MTVQDDDGGIAEAACPAHCGAQRAAHNHRGAAHHGRPCPRIGPMWRTPERSTSTPGPSKVPMGPRQTRRPGR